MHDPGHLSAIQTGVENFLLRFPIIAKTTQASQGKGGILGRKTYAALEHFAF